VDFATQQLSGAVEGEQVVTTIKNRQQLDGTLILQGTENGRGWSMAINEKSGEMTLTVSGDQVGFVTHEPRELRDLSVQVRQVDLRFRGR